MANKKKAAGVVTKTVRGRSVDCIQPGSQAMDDLLAVGYGMSVAEARTIIKERDENPHSWPYEEYKKAKAMLAAFEAEPQVISETPGWVRQRDAR